MTTSSANPEALVAYAREMHAAGEAVLAGNNLQTELDALVASSGDYLRGGFGDLEQVVTDAVRVAQELDTWAGTVGQKFRTAGGGPGAEMLRTVVTIADDRIIGALSSGLVDPPSETRRGVDEGTAALTRLREACESRDHEEIEDLLAELDARQTDGAFMAGFAAASEDDLGEFADLEAMLVDGMRPENRSGFLGGVVDVLDGTWDSVWETVTFLGALTVQVADDVDDWQEDWKNLGSGLWEGVQNPGEFVDAVLDVEGFDDNQARWAGGFIPDLLLAVVTGGSGAAVTGTRSVKVLDDAAGVARAIDKLDEVADVARTVDKLDEVADVARTVDKLDDVGDTASGIDEAGDVGAHTSGIASVSPSQLIDAPIWTASKSQAMARNAYRHYLKHRMEFTDVGNSVEYVAKAQNFLNHPPGGTLSKVRSLNGDIVRYHPSSNTFGVMDAHGSPRTLFRPDPLEHGYPTNLDYFYAQ